MASTENMFADSSVTSVADDGPSRQSPSAKQPGLVRQMERGTTLLGRGPRPTDARKYGNFDMQRARATKALFYATKDDRMSAEEAGDKLKRLQEMFGLGKAEEGVVLAFNNALFYAHTINSGSTLQPGRCVMKVVSNTGGVFACNFVEVVRYLREDLRRFFRAFADDIAQVNEEILNAYDPYDYDSVEKYGNIMSVAIERGLSRFPAYAHDSSDACVENQPAVKAAIASSKRFVLSTIINSADTIHANARVQTRDNYDSTNNTQVDADRAAVPQRT